MNKNLANQVIGNYCAIVRMNGTTEIRRLEDGKDVFETAKGIIGCKYLDHVRVQQSSPGIEIEFLVNEEGYMQWGNDPAKVNPIGTYIYAGGQKPDHYILGDAVFCLMVDGDEGGEFTGMCEKLATAIAMKNNSDLIGKARAVVGNPIDIPNPKVTISGYATTEDLFKAINGDKSVKPIEETVI